MHASTGINRYMHEFQNRPTAGSSDCPGCARQRGVAGRTRDLFPGGPLVAGGDPKAILSPGPQSQGSARRQYPALAAASAVSSHLALSDSGDRPEAVLSHARAVACPLGREGELGGAGWAGRAWMVGRVWGGRPEAGLRVLQKESCTIRNKPGLVAPVSLARDRLSAPLAQCWENSQMDQLNRRALQGRRGAAPDAQL